MTKCISRTRPTIDCSNDKVLVEQAHKTECDMNWIVSRYQKTGVIDHLNKHQAQYGDITPSDFQSSMEIIATANSMFEELPSNIRTFFENDPSKFLEFVQDPKNIDQMCELGLATKTSPEAPETPPETKTPPTKAEVPETPREGGERA